MASREENLKNTLRFLTLLFPEQRLDPDDVDFRKKTVKDIYVETLQENNITPVEFTHSIKELYKRGYVFYSHAFYDPKARQEVIDEYEDKEKYKELERLLNEKHAEIDGVMKDSADTYIVDALPAELKFGNDLITREDTVGVEQVLKDLRDYVDMLRNGLVVRLIVVPFRSVHSLYNKLEDGLTLQEATAGEMFYMPERSELFVQGYVFSTKGKGEIPYYRYVLEKLAESDFRDEVFYTELEYFRDVPQHDQRFIKEKFRKSCYGFRDKIHKKVPVFLLVSTTSVRVNPLYIK